MLKIDFLPTHTLVPKLTLIKPLFLS